MPEWVMQLLLGATASLTASAIVSGVTVLVVLRVGVARLEERVNQKFASLESETKKLGQTINEKAEQIEEKFEQRFSAVEGATTQRVEDYKLWRAGLEARLTSRADHLTDHEKECSERWQKLLERYGGMKAQLDTVIDLMNSRTEAWEKLREEHGGVMERLRSIDDQAKARRRR